MTGAIVSGIGITGIGRRTDVVGRDLTRTAALAAIEDAGLTPADVDGVATHGETPVSEVIEDLSLEVGYIGGGYNPAALLAPVISSAEAIAAGRARHVLVYRTVKMMGGAVVSSDGGGDALADFATLLTYHAYSAANWVALHCQRHMHLYGTTKEQLGALAISSRGKAALNPLAVYRDPITMDDYLSARPVSDPLGLLDCDVPIDGSIAVVLSVPEHAASCPNRPVRIEATGSAVGEGGWDQRPDYPVMAPVDAAADLWSRTSLTPADVDVAQLYDGFTFLTLAWLEALGFCGHGEGGAFLEGGHRIALDGALPLNTYGGQLSAGRMHGYWTLHEAVTQLRGLAADRQVPDAGVAVISAGGGPVAGCMLLTQ
ncbi:thiolase family protein [Candidatus Poriferisocius sp.]|uniref:thiolase family protein n=1 Tax=Candidatus Poriferisocius sp. TaxID=3101276 RepID=UPI003B029630